jgi:hypothetical protein
MGGGGGGGGGGRAPPLGGVAGLMENKANSFFNLSLT